MGNKLNQMMQKGIGMGWSVFAGLILFLLVCFAGNVNYMGKREFVLSYGIILLLGMVFVLVVAMVYIRHRNAVDRFTNRMPRCAICILSCVLFFIQLIVFYNIYFETGWDSGYVVSIARRIAAGEEGFTAWYFGRYPNNFFLVWFYGFVFRIMSWLGLGAWDGFAIVTLQCALSCLCGYLLYKFIADFANNTVAIAAWFIFAVHIGLSPWMVVLYSDPLALCFPMILLRLYQLTGNGRFVWLKWVGIGIFSYIGYKVKPQIAIVFIAIILIETIGFIQKVNKKTVQSFLGKLCTCGVGGLAVMLLFTRLLLPSLPFIYNNETAFGIPHYFMMGLNTTSQGGYAQDDVDFSNSFYTVEVRNVQNLRIAAQRLRTLGLKGLTVQYARKVLINYGDGTYAWSGEGTFYQTMFEDRNSVLSPALKNIYYRDGTMHPQFQFVQQFIWFILLAGSVGVGLFFFRNRTFPSGLVVPLALMGLTVFITVFEARARYLFAFSPFFIIAGALGWIGIAQTVRNLIRKKSVIAPQYQSS